MIYAPIPIYGRFSLVKLTIERLIKQGITPIGIGSEPQAKQICEDLGVEYIEHFNVPLGAKMERNEFERYNFKKYRLLIWVLVKFKVVPYTFYIKYCK